LTSFIVGPASDLTVDWMVIPYVGGLGPPAGGFLYAYQLENTTGTGVDAFSITLPPGTAPSVLFGGIILGDDLDLPTPAHPPHAGGAFPVDGPVPGPFPILDGPPLEEGPFPLVPLAATLTTLDLAGSNITWTFAPLAAGVESDTLFFVSTLPPTYGPAGAQDTIPPSPWNSLAPGGEPVPVPIPEPVSTTLLVLAGLSALTLRPRRRDA
jgi:hypothetical protein